MKEQTFRHVCFDFADGLGVAIRTLDPVEKVTAEVLNPKNWKDRIPPTIVRAWEERY